jgi:hypothetical protein
MVKGRGERSTSGESSAARSRGKRDAVSEVNSAFMQAFADALRDILRDERRRAAAA